MSSGVSRTVAIVGQPNCGKSALFNALTGARQKVGNYNGVTVEKKTGILLGADLQVADLPGTYSLRPVTIDESITVDVLRSRQIEGESISGLLIVVDAHQLERGLTFVLEVLELGFPAVLAINMIDLARRSHFKIDATRLTQEIGIPTVLVSALTGEGLDQVKKQLILLDSAAKTPPKVIGSHSDGSPSSFRTKARQILRAAGFESSRVSIWTRRLDSVLLHPALGLVSLALILLLVFQAVFWLASFPQDWIEAGLGVLQKGVLGFLGEGPLADFLTEGLLAGVGSVIVFLPQILILFSLILILEDSGYMARAAFLLDHWMGKVGLHGRALIPLLSSHACAIPGIMATRTIADPKDRLATILVAPLTTCSARLPVYSLLISAFIPAQLQFLGLGARGLVLLGLYVLGMGSALAMAFVFKRTLLASPMPPLILELPTYKLPIFRNLFRSLVEKASAFLRRAGTVILGLSVLIWFLTHFPGTSIFESFAGQAGRFLEPVFAPIGFDWRIVVALIPGFAAREVMVGVLGTVFASEVRGEVDLSTLGQALASQWSVATGLSLIVWYVFASQCVSTLVVVRKETGSWKWSMVLLLYTTVLAYTASFVVFQFASHLK